MAPPMWSCWDPASHAWRYPPEALLQSTVVVLYAPGPAFELLLTLRSHPQVAGGSMLHVSAWEERPEHFEQSVAPQTHHSPFGQNLQCLQPAVTLPARVHPSAGFKLGQPGPTATGHFLQIPQAAVPTVEEDVFGPGSSPLCRAYSISRKSSFLFFPLRGLS